MVHDVVRLSASRPSCPHSTSFFDDTCYEISLNSIYAAWTRLSTQASLLAHGHTITFAKLLAPRTSSRLQEECTAMHNTQGTKKCLVDPKSCYFQQRRRILTHTTRPLLCHSSANARDNYEHENRVREHNIYWTDDKVLIKLSA